MEETSESQHLIAYCTCPPETASELARELVRRRVCACVNVVPGLTSVYDWKGKIEEDSESLLVIKTRRDSFPALEQAVSELHPYEVFELIATSVEVGNKAYLQWLDDCIKPRPIS